MDLAGSEGGVGFEEIGGGLLVIGGVGNAIDTGGVWNKRGCLGRQSIAGYGDAGVEMVEEVEGICGEVETVALGDVDFAHKPKVGGAVIRSGKGVAAVAGETVVEIVAVLIGIAANGRIDRTSAAGGHDAGNFPVVQDVAEEFLSAMKGAGLEGEGGDEAAALVGNAGTAFGIRLVGILDGGGRAGDEGVLTVVDGARVGVGEAEISTAGHAAVDGDGCAVV